MTRQLTRELSEARRILGAEARTARANLEALPHDAPTDLRAFLEERHDILANAARFAGAGVPPARRAPLERSACGRFLAVVWFDVVACRGRGVWPIGGMYATAAAAQDAAASMQPALPGFELRVLPNARYFSPSSRLDRDEAARLAALVVPGGW